MKCIIFSLFLVNPIISPSDLAVVTLCSGLSSAHAALSSCVALCKAAREHTCLRETCRLISTTATWELESPLPVLHLKMFILLLPHHPPRSLIVLSCRQTSIIWAIFRQSSTSWCHHLLCSMCHTSTIISPMRIFVLLPQNCPWLHLHLVRSVRKPFVFQQGNTAI